MAVNGVVLLSEEITRMESFISEYMAMLDKALFERPVDKTIAERMLSDYEEFLHQMQQKLELLQSVITKH